MCEVDRRDDRCSQDLRRELLRKDLRRWTVVGPQPLRMGGAWTSLQKGKSILVQEGMWDHLRDWEHRLAEGQAGEGAAEWGHAVGTLNARLRSGEVKPVSFHFWLGCPWLAQGSRAAPISESEAAPFLTDSCPSEGAQWAPCGLHFTTVRLTFKGTWVLASPCGPILIQ